MGYNKCGELSIHQHEKPKRKKKEEKKEGRKKKEKKKILQKVLDERSHTKKKRRVLNHHFLVGKFVSADARLFIINLNTQDSTQTER